MENQQCGNCRFYMRDSDDHDIDDLGFCRRHPPIISQIGSTMPQPIYLKENTLPPVGGDFWCGEWKEPAAPAAERSKLFGCSLSEIVTQSQLEKAMEAKGGSLNIQTKDILRKLVYSGVQVGELLEMTPSDFNALKYCGVDPANAIAHWLALHEKKPEIDNEQ